MKDGLEREMGMPIDSRGLPIAVSRFRAVLYRRMPGKNGEGIPRILSVCAEKRISLLQEKMHVMFKVALKV